MPPALFAPLAAFAVLAAGAAVLAVQRASQRRLTGARAPGIDGGGPDILYFTGPNCTICHVAQRPALARLHGTIDDLAVREIDVAADPAAARAFRVMTLPTTIVLDVEGRISAVNAGFASETVLRGQVEAARAVGAGEAVA